MSLDPKGLEAAVAACRDLTFNALTIDECRDTVKAAITEYLASIQAEPAAWVSQSALDRLRASGTPGGNREMLWSHDEPRYATRVPLYAAPVPPSPISVEKVLAVLESLAEAARSSCDARQFPALTEALAEADYSLKGRG